MTDQSTIEQLRRATDAAVRDHHLDPAAAQTAWAIARAPRSRGRLVAAVAATVVVTAGAAVAVAAWPRDHHAHQAGSGSACARGLVDAPLPDWARAGFSPPGQRIPHAVGEHGLIVAVPFVHLRVHQPAGTNNKVLWVARSGFGPLTIHGTLEGSSAKVTRTLADGPGPSYVDLPAPGCWHLQLSWAGRSDRLALEYGP